ncbi:hypothetical protein EC957_010291 [Mortierella hygrophila]|uniref:Uncharacterized protein n=1 Tax=Mortierella hygrophila TaxID=979708 RepID=A0A9P6K4W3_9FUNG|nr:hypothetical protein EC957_010291 [Mortierella hygrophila]
MSQHEQNPVGSIDPFAHTSNSKVNTDSSSDNLDGPTHHSASPSVGGEVYQQSQAPLDPSSASKTAAIITTTTTTVTKESTSTRGRKSSLTDTLITGAATAATTATNVAAHAVAAARKLVGNHGSSEIDLNSETPDTVQAEETSSSSKGGILNFMKSSSTNNGLEFSQRKLSSNKHKSHSSHRHHVPSATAAAASVPTVSHTNVHHDVVQPPMKSVIPNNTTTQTTAQDSNTQHTLQNSMQHPVQGSSQYSMEQQHPAQEEQQDPMQQQQNPMQQAMPDYAQTATPAPAPTNITFSEKPPITRTNNNGPTSTTSTTAAAPITSFLPRKGTIAGQTAVLKEPHNTFYVTHQGGTNSQALGVDQPSVSLTSKTIKTQTHSALGVDKPLYVGVHDDPKTQARIRSSLHVDKEPVFSQNALNDSNNKGQNSYTGNLLEDNSVADNENPVPLKDSRPPRRRLSYNGLNVDPPSVATSNIAGSGSTDNTNTNRPKGTFNSGYNVDRAGHHDQKTSGFGVDKPAFVTHQLAAAPKLQNPAPIVPGLNTKTTTTNNGSHSPTFNPQNSTTRPYSTTTTTSETVIDPAEMGPTVTYQNPASLSTSAPVDPIVIPADYKGPIPQVNPGEKIIWVKKTVVQTEYYDGAHDNTGSTMPPEPTQDSGIQNRRGSSGSLLDRIRGRRSSVVSMDKGKQRT